MVKSTLVRIQPSLLNGKSINCIYCGCKLHKSKKTIRIYRTSTKSLLKNNFSTKLVNKRVQKIESSESFGFFKKNKTHHYDVKIDMWFCYLCRKKIVTNLPQKYTERELIIKHRVKDK